MIDDIIEKDIRCSHFSQDGNLTLTNMIGVGSKNQLNKTQEWAFLHYSGSCNFIQFSVTWGGDLMVED